MKTAKIDEAFKTPRISVIRNILLSVVNIIAGALALKSDRPWLCFWLMAYMTIITLCENIKYLKSINNIHALIVRFEEDTEDDKGNSNGSDDTKDTK